MRNIRRYKINKNEATPLELHVQGKILAFDIEDDKCSIVVEENPSYPTRTRYFNVFDDSHEDMGDEWAYTGHPAWDGTSYFFLYEDLS